jgi:hypothetical protein
MAPTKATPVKKTERKKPVRTAPVQKDYPSKLAYLKAMLDHEEAEAAKVNAAKVARLDKRIASKKAAIETATAELAALNDERAKLVPAEPETDGNGLTKEDILVLEGKD